jgi:hypothetical protein
MFGKEIHTSHSRPEVIDNCQIWHAVSLWKPGNTAIAICHEAGKPLRVVYLKILHALVGINAAVGDGDIFVQSEEVVRRKTKTIMHGRGELAVDSPTDLMQTPAEQLTPRRIVDAGQADVLRESRKPPVGQGRPDFVT